MRLKLTLLLLLLFLIVLRNTHAQEADSLSNKTPKIGLVLSGGGAKGFAHIGVLKVLEEQGIKPDYISGTSMGAIVGALYSLGYSANQLEEIVVNIDWNDILSDKISIRDIPVFDKNEYPGYPLKMFFNNGVVPSLPSGMNQGQKIQALFSELVWKSQIYSNFDEFPIPFRCVAIDILSGQTVVFKDGDLSEALRSSMSIPTVFSPVEKDSMLLVDGGVLKNFPVQECIDMGAELIIGVYTGFDGSKEKDELQSMVKVLTRSSAIRGVLFSREEAKKTNVFIVPEFNKLNPDDFQKSEEIIAIGEIAARDSAIIDELKIIAAQTNSSLPLDKSLDTITTLIDTSKIWIDDIQVTGCVSTDSNTVIRISELENKSKISSKDADLALQNIYSTWQFKKVTYHIKKDSTKRTLVFKVDEGSRAFLNLGLHYDNSYGPNALLKATYNNLFFKSTKAYFKFSISQNPRALLSYKFYPTKRRKLEVALNIYSQLNKMPDIIKEENIVYTLGHYVYTMVDFNMTISWSPFKNMMLQASAGRQFNNIVLKEGMEIYYNTNTVNYHFSFYDFRLYVNTLNDPYFPTKGLFIDAKYKYNFNIKSNQSDTSYLSKNQTSNNNILTLNYKQYFLIAKKFSIFPELSFGSMTEEAFITEKFFLGGVNYSLRPNVYNFGGIQANYLATDIFFMAGLGGQYIIRDNWFLQFGVQYLIISDYADIESEDIDEVFMDKAFGSWKAGIGYQSRFGPIRVVLSKSPERKEFVWSVNIGIPF